MDTDRDGDGWGAMADGTRRTIVARLADHPMAVGELAAELPVTRSAVSQHLKVLKDAGLVSETCGGNPADLPTEPGGGGGFCGTSWTPFGSAH